MDTLQNNVCKVEGHEEQQLIPYLCVSQKCDQMSRFMCQGCLVDFLHSHNGQKPQLLSKEKLSEQFKSNILNLKEKHSKKMEASQQQNKQTLQIVTEIEVLIQGLKQVLQQQNHQSSDSDEKYFESLNNLITESFFQLSNDNIKSILNISDYKLNTQSTGELKQIFQDLTLSFETLRSRINSLYDFNTLKQNCDNIDDNIRQFKYVDEYLQAYSSKRDYNYINISPNNKFIAIAYNGEYQQFEFKRNKKNNQQDLKEKTSYEYCLEIIDLSSKPQQKIKLAHSQIDFLQFSYDSQILYYQEKNEPFSSYQISNGRTIQYKHFLELKQIKLIFPMQQNKAFVINQFNNIQLLDMEFENKLYEIQSKSLDIVYDNINKILFSSWTSIEIFDGETGIKINDNSLKLDLSNLQLSWDRTKLFASDREHFYILQISNNQKLIELNMLQKMKYQENIISYSLVWNQQYIVIFGENGIIAIYDLNFKMIKQFFLGQHGNQRMYFRSGCCSDDFSEITVASTTKNKFQRLELKVAD